MATKYIDVFKILGIKSINIINRPVQGISLFDKLLDIPFCEYSRYMLRAQKIRILFRLGALYNQIYKNDMVIRRDIKRYIKLVNEGIFCTDIRNIIAQYI